MEHQTPPSSQKAPATRAAPRIYWLSLAALIGMMILGALLTVREWVVLIPSFQGAMQDLLSRGSLLTLGLVIALLVFALIFRRSLRNRTPQAAELDAALKPTGWALVSVFAAFALAILGAGYLLQSDLRTAFSEERYSQQSAIARLKAQQIDQWVSERAIDLGFLATSLKGLPLERIEQAPELQRIVDLLLYQILIGHHERREVMLFSSEGQLLVQAGGIHGHDNHTELEGLVRDAARDGKLKVGPVRLDAAIPPRPTMSFAQPLDAGTAPALRRFVVVLVVDPAIELFKKIQNWPTDSATSEVLLARRDGDDVLYFITPRFWDVKPSPVALRLPLTTPNLPMAAAILKGDGTRTGLDYRRIDVLTASRTATAVPWVVVAKTDYAEAMGPVDRQVDKIVLLFGAIVVVAAFLVWSLMSSQRETFLTVAARQFEEKSNLAVRELRFAHAVQDPLIFFDKHNHIIETNEAAQRILGYSAEELQGMEARDLRVTGDVAAVDLPDELAFSRSNHEFRAIVRRKDGSTFPAGVRVSTFEHEGETYRQAMAIDISDRVKLEQEVVRLARIKRSLQSATSILLSVHTEAEMFRQICLSFVEFGNYRLAYIAIPNVDPGKTFRIATSAGYDEGYLAQAQPTWNDEPTGNGRLGRAIKTGTVQINQDLESDPETQPLREEARRRGYRSTIALPLRRHGKVTAVLCIYAAEPQAFDTEEVKLLSALADDISHALSSMAPAPGPTV